jgi:hypothetical protein
MGETSVLDVSSLALGDGVFLPNNDNDLLYGGENIVFEGEVTLLNFDSLVAVFVFLGVLGDDVMNPFGSCFCCVGV